MSLVVCCFLPYIQERFLWKHLEEDSMKSAATRQNARRLNQEKLNRLKTLLGVQSDSEAIEQAVDLLLAEEDIKTTLRKVKGKGRIERVFA
jgi:hypothetical protein